MNFGFLKKVPKFTFVAFILVGSTLLFWFWWHFHGRKAAPDTATSQPTPVEVAQRPIADFSSGHHFFMAGDDLYDTEAGQLVSRNFLNGDHPIRLLYEPQSKKLIGTYDNGIARYALDGKREGQILQAHKVVMVPDSKKIIYTKNKDVWQGELDLVNFQLVGEKQITSTGQIDDFNFADNVLLLTDDLMLLRNMNQLIRVELGTGRVKPAPQLNMLPFGKCRSPDSKTVVGIEQSQFFFYDFESDSLSTKPLGRSRMVDCQWVDKDHCVLVVNGSELAMVDRQRRTVNDFAAMQNAIRYIAEPSPGGRFLFCVTQLGQISAVDVESKKIIPLATDAQNYFWLNDDTLIFSREIQDTDKRGTWVKQLGGTETRVSEEPYLCENGAPFARVFKDCGLVIFETRKGLFKANQDFSVINPIGPGLGPERLILVETKQQLN